jgi:hypothetical protein
METKMCEKYVRKVTHIRLQRPMYSSPKSSVVFALLIRCALPRTSFHSCMVQAQQPYWIHIIICTTDCLDLPWKTECYDSFLCWFQKEPIRREKCKCKQNCHIHFRWLLCILTHETAFGLQRRVAFLTRQQKSLSLQHSLTRSAIRHVKPNCHHYSAQHTRTETR